MVTRPTLQEISTLVSHRDRDKPFCADRSAALAKGLTRAGRAVNSAIERFVTIGESIANDNPEIKGDMFQACKEARSSGFTIESLCEKAFDECTDNGAVVKAARILLHSVTRVLLLADSIVVRQLLSVNEKICRSLGKLENVSNFTDFVRAFSEFGTEMVELAHLTGDRQNDTKDERRKSQMAAARAILERSTMLLLVSSKACFRHPECESARTNRNTVFCQMRRAIDLIHFVVKDGICEGGGEGLLIIGACKDPLLGVEDSETLGDILRRLMSLVEIIRLTLNLGDKDSLSSTLEALVENIQDFTYSAYTSHQRRQNIVQQSQKIKKCVDRLIMLTSGLDEFEVIYPTEELEMIINNSLESIKELRVELLAVTREQVNQLAQLVRTANDLVSIISHCALASNFSAIREHSTKFQSTVDHISEIVKLTTHMANAEGLQVIARNAEINLKIYSPLVVNAAQTLAHFPSSKIAKENLNVFAEMWHSLIRDTTSICKEVMDKQRVPEKHTYMSLPRPGKHGSMIKPMKSVKLDVEEQDKLAKSGLEMKLASSEVDSQMEKWKESENGHRNGHGNGNGNGNGKSEENNDIIVRAKNMAHMAIIMYEFTKGKGVLANTQDLFTQGEYFAEEANRLYKVVREFSYLVPSGSPKRELLEQLREIPQCVQELQFTVKNPTVGKTATFVKVDSVINETRTLMGAITKVVTTCYICSTQYNLDFNTLANQASMSLQRDEDNGGGSGSGDGKLATGTNSDGSI